MQFFQPSTALPLLKSGEPPCPEAAHLAGRARRALLACALGQMRRAGSTWFGRDKQEPFPVITMRVLIKHRLVCIVDRNHIRPTKRGLWCARTLCSEIAAQHFAIGTVGEHNT